MDIFVSFFQLGLSFCQAVCMNWGLAIILFTTLLRVGLFPLQILTSRQQALLKRIKPQLDELQKKYQSDLKGLLREQKELHEKNGVRPWLMMLGSLLQIPIFLGVFRAISTTASLEHISFAWIPNLAAFDPLFILPALAALIFWQQMRAAGQTPKGVSFALPVLGFVFMAQMPAAVALYSLTSSVWQFVGQKALEGFSS